MSRRTIGGLIMGGGIGGAILVVALMVPLTPELIIATTFNGAVITLGYALLRSEKGA